MYLFYNGGGAFVKKKDVIEQHYKKGCRYHRSQFQKKRKKLSDFDSFLYMTFPGNVLKNLSS
ncbi:MAG TPA: hypothetical protein DD740_05690 [Chryseobacterium sp.]|nr:hypothetical protein [Chryseobacterium sp.]